MGLKHATSKVARGSVMGGITIFGQNSPNLKFEPLSINFQIANLKKY